MNNKIRIGIWGLGRAGWNMHCRELDRFNDCFSVIAGCDHIAKRVKDLEERYPGAKGYTDGNAFVADPNIEMISIATYSLDHVMCAEMALSAGKYVFLEKPIAVTKEMLDKLVELNQKFPGKIFCRHNRRFESAFNHIMEIMHKGLLGEVFEIKLCRHRQQFRNDWQTLRSCGGGQLNNWGPHLIDHALRFLESPVKDIWSDLKQVATLGDAEDHVKFILRGTNGRYVDVEISDGVLLPGDVYQVFGTRGTLVSKDESDLHLKYLNPAEKLPAHGAHSESPSRFSGYGGEIKSEWIEETIKVAPANQADVEDIYSRVYKTLRENVPFPVKFEEALEVVKTTLAIKSQSDRFSS